MAESAAAGVRRGYNLLEVAKSIWNKLEIQLCMSISHYSNSHSPTHLCTSQLGHKAVAGFSKTPHHAPQYLADYWNNWKHMLKGILINEEFWHEEQANILIANK